MYSVSMTLKKKRILKEWNVGLDFFAIVFSFNDSKEEENTESHEAVSTQLSQDLAFQ